MFALLTVTEEVATPTVWSILLDDTFLIFVIFAVLSTLIVAFIRRKHKDRCLRSYDDDFVSILMNDGRLIKGKILIENTGVEVFINDGKNSGIYKINNPIPENGELLTKQSVSHARSIMIYKDELANLVMIARFHEDLNKKAQKSRIKELNRVYHPSLFRKLNRGIGNFFRIIKDSLLEIITKPTAQITSTVNPKLSGNEAYTNKVNQELLSTLDTAYDPLWEKYIGNIVICDCVFQAGKISKLAGVLKDYTTNYIELLDVTFKNSTTADSDDTYKKADIILPRKIVKIRHLGEENNLNIFEITNQRIRRTYKSMNKKSNIKFKEKNDMPLSDNFFNI